MNPLASSQKPSLFKQTLFKVPVLFILTCIFALNIYVYSQSASGPYIIDDYPNLINNNFLIIEDLNYTSIKKTALSSSASSYYRPISMLSFAANYTAAGSKAAFPVKMTNIFIHVVIGLGIYLLTIGLLTRLNNRAFILDNQDYLQLIAISSCFVWLFHPLFVSTVLYPVQRMAILSTFFVIYGCYGYMKLRENQLAQ